jgi:hypothetical protein
MGSSTPAGFSVYTPKSSSVVHFDGALRIYTLEQLASRGATHIRNAGKCGTRVKLFNFVNPIRREAFLDLAAAYYVWNEDVQACFRGESTAKTLRVAMETRE